MTVFPYFSSSQYRQIKNLITLGTTDNMNRIFTHKQISKILTF